MTHYQREVSRISRLVYHNHGQLQVVIGMKNYMDAHFAENLDLNILSGARFVSKFHLLRLFKRYYGQTPRQYLIDRRIEESKVLLRLGASIASTCYAVGFESPASFSTLFKTRTGKTPVDYKKAQLSQSPAE